MALDDGNANVDVASQEKTTLCGEDHPERETCGSSERDGEASTSKISLVYSAVAKVLDTADLRKEVAQHITDYDDMHAFRKVCRSFYATSHENKHGRMICCLQQSTTSELLEYYRIGGMLTPFISPACIQTTDSYLIARTTIVKHHPAAETVECLPRNLVAFSVTSRRLFAPKMYSEMLVTQPAPVSILVEVRFLYPEHQSLVTQWESEFQVKVERKEGIRLVDIANAVEFHLEAEYPGMNKWALKVYWEQKGVRTTCSSQVASARNNSLKISNHSLDFESTHGSFWQG